MMEALCVVRVVWGSHLQVEADQPYPSALPLVMRTQAGRT